MPPAGIFFKEKFAVLFPKYPGGECRRQRGQRPLLPCLSSATDDTLFDPLVEDLKHTFDKCGVIDVAIQGLKAAISTQLLPDFAAERF